MAAQLGGSEDRETPSFFLEPGIQSPSCCHVRVAAAKWDWALWTELREVGTPPWCCQHWIPCAGSPQPGQQQNLHRHMGCPQRPSQTAQTHAGSLISQLFVGCYVFIAFLNSDDFPLRSRECRVVMDVTMVCAVSLGQGRDCTGRSGRAEPGWCELPASSLALVAFTVWHRSEERLFHRVNTVWPGSWCS